tara:strand:- start:435 stop:815 length:381 start_codon:yes stop_codon:yes gene_type:complete
MKMLFDLATEELHGHLSSWLHAGDGLDMIVRRLRQDSNQIIVDLVAPRSTAEIDRFVLTFLPHVNGNCDADGVNIQQRKIPTIITAIAGTLTTNKHEATFNSPEKLRLWMRTTAGGPCDLCAGKRA